MFKTIQECRLDLVAHSVKADLDTDRFSNEDSLDFFPASAARVSFGNEDKTGKNPEADKKLMKYLADHEHMSPFEHQSVTFLVEVPLFIRSQIMRHRTFAYNEISRRYTDENLEFWIPDTFRGQAVNNRQASSDEKLPQYMDTEERNGVDRTPHDVYVYMMEEALGHYNEMIKFGVAREQARAVLPQSLLTKFYQTGSLRNWAHFIKLRTHEGAQKEVQILAERISRKLSNLWPTAWGVLVDADRT